MRKLMRKRKALSKKLTKCTIPERIAWLRQELFTVESSVRSSHDRFREEEERKAVLRCRTDPAYFYQYARRKSRLPPAVGPLAAPDGSITSSPREMAELLSRQYASFFSMPTEPCTESVTQSIFPQELPG